MDGLQRGPFVMLNWALIDNASSVRLLVVPEDGVVLL